MGFNIRGGDKSSLALLSSKRGRAYARTRADEAFALPDFSDAMPVATTEPQQQLNNVEQPVEHDAENVKQTMLQHESVFKEQLHELHRLYQKQCVLMAESNNDPAGDRASEPPSSNSSFPVPLKLQGERSFGDASLPENNQSYYALLRMDDVKCLEDCELSRQQSSHRHFEACGSSRKQSIHQMFDLEQPAAKRPIIDLERPADEYMDVEVQVEKPQIASLTVEQDTFASRHSHFLGSKYQAGEKGELPSGESRGSWDNKLMGFQIVNGREEMLKGYLKYKESASTQPEELLSPSGPVKSLTCPKVEPPLYAKEALSASGLFRGLPDLNGDVNFTEPQAFAEENVKDRQCIDLEVDPRSCSSSSKLPHWLCQAPTVGTSVSAQSSPCHPKTSIFLPQVHDQTTNTPYFLPQVHEKTNWRSNLPMEMTKTSSMQEPNFPWSQSTTCFEQGQISFNDPLSASSSQFFRGANPGIAEGLYPGVHGREYISGGTPFFSSQARESENVGIRMSVNDFPSVMGRQGLQFEARDPSAELPSRVSSEGPMSFPTMPPWYQQRESFSLLLQQASNPEPFCSTTSPVSSVNLWESGFSFKRPSYGMDHAGQGLYGLHTHVRHTEGSSSRPISTTAGPTIDISMKGSEITSCKQVETPYFIAQAPAVSASSNHHRDLNSRKPLFDLNVSSEDSIPDGNIDACDIVDTSCHANQQQSLKKESEISRSAGWGTLSGIKAPLLYEPQTESGSCFGDRVGAKGTAFEAPFDTNATYLHNEASYLSKPGDLRCSEGDMLRNGTCADYCSGEDETGGGFVGVKSSDGSGLTSCESRDGVHLEFIKARDDSNTSSGEGCHSLESRIPNHKDDAAFASSLQRTRSVGLPLQVNAVSGDQFASLLFSNRQIISSHYEPQTDCLQYNYTESGDESEPVNVVGKKDLLEASEAAELLLSLGLDQPSMPDGGDATDDCRKCLAWLADIIPLEGNCEPKDISIEMAFLENHVLARSAEQTFEMTTEKTLDSFELAVLALKPVDSNLECLASMTLDTGNVVENTPTLRRRPSRRGRAGKDFQKEMLRSMSSLSRHEVTEDLQIIEGLIKSTAEPINSSSPSPDDKPLSSPEQGLSKSLEKGKVTKSCTARKLNGTLKVCSWGESTRRKRMGRQRSQWLSLPPGVRTSLFPNNATDVVS